MLCCHYFRIACDNQMQFFICKSHGNHQVKIYDKFTQNSKQGMNYNTRENHLSTSADYKMEEERNHIKLENKYKNGGR